MRRSVRANFVLCSVFVGCNQGAITLTLAMASSLVGPAIAGAQSGVLFSMYTLSALFFAAPIVRRFGVKTTLAASLFVQSAYVGAYLFAVAVPSAVTGVGLVGTALGGVASGTLWPAQGAYFALSAQQHAESRGEASTRATSRFAAYFATIYLSIEVCVKMA
jgi:MFS family permease